MSAPAGHSRDQVTTRRWLPLCGCVIPEAQEIPKFKSGCSPHYPLFLRPVGSTSSAWSTVAGCPVWCPRAFHHGLAPGEPAGGRKASRQGETEAAVSAQTHLACSRRQRHSLTLGSASSPSAARSACSSWSGPLRSLLPVRRPRGKFLSSPPLAQVQAGARRGPLRPPGGASSLPRAGLSAVPTRTDTPAPARSQGRFPDRTASHSWHRSPS